MSEIHSKTITGVFISQLIRLARASHRYRVFVRESQRLLTEFQFRGNDPATLVPAAKKFGLNHLCFPGIKVSRFVSDLAKPF